MPPILIALDWVIMTEQVISLIINHNFKILGRDDQRVLRSFVVLIVNPVCFSLFFPFF